MGLLETLRGALKNDTNEGARTVVEDVKPVAPSPLVSRIQAALAKPLDEAEEKPTDDPAPGLPDAGPAAWGKVKTALKLLLGSKMYEESERTIRIEMAEGNVWVTNYDEMKFRGEERLVEAVKAHLKKEGAATTFKPGEKDGEDDIEEAVKVKYDGDEIEIEASVLGGGLTLRTFANERQKRAEISMTTFGRGKSASFVLPWVEGEDAKAMDARLRSLAKTIAPLIEQDLVVFAKSVEGVTRGVKLTLESVDLNERLDEDSLPTEGKARAMQRIDDAAKRSGILGAIKATEQRVKAITDKGKAKGVVDACDELIAALEGVKRAAKAKSESVTEASAQETKLIRVAAHMTASLAQVIGRKWSKAQVKEAAEDVTEISDFSKLVVDEYVSSIDWEDGVDESRAVTEAISTAEFAETLGDVVQKTLAAVGKKMTTQKVKALLGTWLEQPALVQKALGKLKDVTAEESVTEQRERKMHDMAVDRRMGQPDDGERLLIECYASVPGSYGESLTPKEQLRRIVSDLTWRVREMAMEGIGDDGKVIDYARANKEGVDLYDLAVSTVLKEINVSGLEALAEKVRADMKKWLK